MVDEAQDFPRSFLKLCFNILKQPKRLIFAYDELQTLNETSLGSPKKIFGEDVKFDNLPDQPQQDIILEKCYRNSKPILVSAHALGFGINRQQGLVQMFDQPLLWQDVGYDIHEGYLAYGERVTLKRTSRTSPPFLEEHSPIDDLIQFCYFDTTDIQYQWIADQIEINLTEDELEPNDIIVIHPNPIRTQFELGVIRSLLYEKNINSHLAGVNTSPDNFFEKNSITFTSIYRAKGNEAAMVYVVDAGYCFSGSSLKKKRNILFTAMTRSKAWLRVCGVGRDMKGLVEEFEAVKSHEFMLNFTFPTFERMKEMDIIHRDMTREEERVISQLNSNLQHLLSLIEKGIMRPEDIPQNIRDKLAERLND